LLEDHVPDAFASILGRMETGLDDVACRLIDLARSEDLAQSETDTELTWASYERRADASRFINPRWRIKPRAPVQH
jgi:hypothetical protein